jgi:hypothetical protein
MTSAQKAHCFLWAGILAMFGILQLNDPDPIFWASIYFICSGLWMAEWVGIRKNWAIHAIILVLVFWMGTLAQGPIDLINFGDPGDLMAQMSQDKHYIEESREFLGLGICTMSLLILTFKSPPPEKSPNSGR